MGHTTWQELVCDKCGTPAGDHTGPWSYLVRNDDAEDFLDYWKNEGWVYDEYHHEWLCPDCAKKHKAPIFCIHCGEELIPPRKKNGEYCCDECDAKFKVVKA